MAPRGDPASSAADSASKTVSSSSSSSKHKNGGSKWVPRDLRDYEVPQPGGKYVGLLGNTFPGMPFLKRLNWLHVPLLTLTPIIGLYGVFTAPLDWRTYLFAVVYYFFTGLGITAGA
jgi:stearoyl-CoA desaturase (delta-9 desaturase)